jgi:hypothetical protein
MNPVQSKPRLFLGDPMFLEILAELERLHSDKNRQYATAAAPLANFERTGHMIRKFLKPGIDPALASCLSLASKQVDAVYEIVGEQKLNLTEALDDKLRDIAVYSILAMIIVRRGRRLTRLTTLLLDEAYGKKNSKRKTRR